MKKFLYRFLVVVLPVIIPLGLLELGARNIPNDYSFKNNYMSLNDKNIEVLVIGNSHTYLGVNPDFLDSRSFNLSHLGETIEYDFKLFNKYKENLQNLKTVIIPVSYTNMFNRDMPKRRKNYNIYYDLNVNDFPVDNLEILNKDWIDLFEDCYAYYYLGKPSPYFNSSSLGWYENKDKKHELDEKRIEKVAREDAKNNFNQLAFNIRILEELILECKKNDVKVIMISTPLHRVYRRFMKDEQLNLAINAANKLAETNNNVSYYNYIDSPVFLESDFMDGDHLNASGAQKLTIILNDIINKNRTSNE